MEQLIQFIRKHKLIVFGGLALVLVILLVTRGPNVQNPAKDTLSEDPRAGKDYAILYQHGELYDFISERNENLMLIQKDLAVFVRNTEESFKNNEKLVGFTFDKGFKKNGKEGIFTGYYYSVKDKIQLKVNLLGSGVIKLSITNLKTNVNIDNKLNLNGVKNKLLDKLPIDRDYFSIRYLNSTDEIIVTFYDGYTQQDIDGALAILKEAYGDEFKEDDFTYSINGLGIFDLEQVVSNLESPFDR